MGLGYNIGDRVIQIDDKVIGKVIKMYFPTACKQQTMILCDDGRKYHAPSDTFVKIDEQIAIPAGLEAGQDAAQTLLISHDYRDIEIADGMTVTIDVEDLKRQLIESYYPKIGLDYGA